MFSVSLQKSAGKVRRRRLAADSRPRPQPFLQNVLQPAALFLSSHAPAFASPSYTVFDSRLKLPKMTCLENAAATARDSILDP